MKITDPVSGHFFYCGKLKSQPAYTYYNYRSSMGTIDDIEVEFFATSGRFSNVVNFEFCGTWYHTSDTGLNSQVGRKGGFTFEASHGPARKKAKVSRTDRLAHLYDGHTPGILDGVRKEMKESRDCTVRAMAESLAIPYAEAHALLRPYRQHRKGCSMATILQTYFSYRFEQVKDFQAGKISTATFALQYPVGSFIVTVSGHAFAIVDGKIRDHSFRPNAKIKTAFRVIENK